ncbi:MAG: ankyrin repeat domain-containing protein [Solirubrobacterales bacterium]
MRSKGKSRAIEVLSGIGVVAFVVLVMMALLAAVFLFGGRERLANEEWRHRMAEILDQLDRDGAAIVSGEPVTEGQLVPGGWVVVDRSRSAGEDNDLRDGWQFAKENDVIEARAHCEEPSDVAYVAVVSPPRRKSAGYYKHQGQLGGGDERFVSEYTVDLLDWPHKKLIRRESIASPTNPGGTGLWAGWEENQKKPRHTILKWLVDNGVLVGYGGFLDPDWQSPPLVRAAIKGDVRLAEYLLDMGADVNGFSPVVHALEGGHWEMIAFLLQKGARKDIFVMAGTGDLEGVRTAIGTRPRLVNARSPNEKTPLHYAAAFGHKDVAEFLISSGADINVRKGFANIQYGPLGATPLHMAVRHNQKEMVELLLANGADPRITAIVKEGDKAVTPLDYAVEKGYRDIADLLRSR